MIISITNLFRVRRDQCPGGAWIAAVLSGEPSARLMDRHLVPSFMSQIIVSLTLAGPVMILAETALRFLGLTPVILTIIILLAFNFPGDGLHDAADPYSR